MNELTEARAILQSAERGLRSLMESAIQKGRYAEVADLAELAQALGRISSGPISDNPERSSADQIKTGAAMPPVHPAAKGQTKKSKSVGVEFPKFERDSDRLVKIGWSKKDKSKYEHKASRDAVLSVYLRLAGIAAAGPFKMEDAFPITLADGSEIPSYQSYLVLAWLRQSGQVEKLGKDSYRWTVEEVGESSFQHGWEATPRRRTQVRGHRK